MGLGPFLLPGRKRHAHPAKDAISIHRPRPFRRVGRCWNCSVARCACRENFPAFKASASFRGTGACDCDEYEGEQSVSLQREEKSQSSSSERGVRSGFEIDRQFFWPRNTLKTLLTRKGALLLSRSTFRKNGEREARIEDGLHPPAGRFDSGFYALRKPRKWIHISRSLKSLISSTGRKPA